MTKTTAPAAAIASSLLENLEPRRHFSSATIVGRTLLVQTSGQDDHVYVYSPIPINATNRALNVKLLRYRAGTNQTQIVQASKKTYHFVVDDFDRLRIETRGGDDQVDITPGNRDIETSVFAGAGDDTLTGSTGITRAHMGGGDDLVWRASLPTRGRFRAFGQDGDDTLIGMGSADILDGGDGDDHLEGYKNFDTLRGGAGDDILIGDTGSDNSSADLLRGDDGNDQLYGRAGDDTLQGGAGNDALFGGRGNDSLEGGAGDDDLAGNAGSDQLVGGAGNDDVFASDSAGGQTLSDATAEDQGANQLDDAIVYLPA